LTLARRLDFPRSTAQFLAESLAKKGFVSKTIKSKITFYTAERPERIAQIFQEQKEDFLKSHSEKEKSLQDLLPALQSLKKHSLASRPKVIFYEGVDGLARVYDDVLTSSEEVRSMVAYTPAHANKPEKLVIFKKRAAKGIHIRCITRDSQMARERKKNNKKELRKSILVDPEKYSWVPEIQFYDNKVNIASIDENFGVIIESEQIAQAMKNLFDLAWSGAQCENDKRS